MPNVRTSPSGRRADPHVYKPIFYITNGNLRRLLISGRLDLPLIWVGRNNNGNLERIRITAKYLFELCLGRSDYVFAEKIALSGIMNITIDTFISCLSVPECFNIEPVARMIHSMILLEKLERSFLGITIHSCIDLYDKAVVLSGRFGDFYIEESRKNLKSLSDRMSYSYDKRRYVITC